MQDQPRYNLVYATRKHATDDVQKLLIEEAERCFNELWPSSLVAPAALEHLWLAVVQLIDWTARTPKGRATMRERILAQIAQRENRPAYAPNSLLEHPHALKVVPGILAAMLEQELQAADSAELAELTAELDAWLAAGGDGEA